jgi:hypothetical protein
MIVRLKTEKKTENWKLQTETQNMNNDTNRNIRVLIEPPTLKLSS